MGDLADDFRKDKRKLENECPACEGAGFLVVEDSEAESGESLVDCGNCNGEGVL